MSNNNEINNLVDSLYHNAKPSRGNILIITGNNIELSKELAVKLSGTMENFALIPHIFPINENNAPSPKLEVAVSIDAYYETLRQSQLIAGRIPRKAISRGLSGGYSAVSYISPEGLPLIRDVFDKEEVIVVYIYYSKDAIYPELSANIKEWCQYNIKSASNEECLRTIEYMLISKGESKIPTPTLDTSAKVNKLLNKGFKASV